MHRTLVSTLVAFPTWSRQAKFPPSQGLDKDTYSHRFFWQNLHRPRRLTLCMLQAKVSRQ